MAVIPYEVAEEEVKVAEEEVKHEAAQMERLLSMMNELGRINEHACDLIRKKAPREQVIDAVYATIETADKLLSAM